jgi:hypothetical protein
MPCTQVAHDEGSRREPRFSYQSASDVAHPSHSSKISATVELIGNRDWYALLRPESLLGPLEEGGFAIKVKESRCTLGEGAPSNKLLHRALVSSFFFVGSLLHPRHDLHVLLSAHGF